MYIVDRNYHSRFVGCSRLFRNVISIPKAFELSINNIRITEEV